METGLPDFRVLLQALVEHKVDFVVVGGVCAALQGVPLTTYDLDIVHSRAPDNLERLHAALAALDAYYREHPEGGLRPQLHHLGMPGHHLLMTRAGPLDLLGTVVSGQDFHDLVRDVIELDIGGRSPVKVLALRKLIELKESLGRDKDKAVLPILRRTLKESEGGSQ